MQRKTSS